MYVLSQHIYFYLKSYSLQKRQYKEQFVLTVMYNFPNTKVDKHEYVCNLANKRRLKAHYLFYLYVGFKIKWRMAINKMVTTTEYLLRDKMAIADYNEY